MSILRQTFEFSADLLEPTIDALTDSELLKERVIREF
jgi:hypothetical protein